MGRFRRLKLAGDGGMYHVMTRTSRQEYCFEMDSIKEWMYRHVVWLSSIYFVDLYSITILDNHYHLVLRIRKPEASESLIRDRFEAYQKSKKYPLKWFPWRMDEWYRRLTDLSPFMQELNRSIAWYVNGRDGRRGHLWGERFKSVLIEDGIGLLQCMAYVELNPRL